jgi:outer membrane protein W
VKRVVAPLLVLALALASTAYAEPDDPGKSPAGDEADAPAPTPLAKPERWKRVYLRAGGALVLPLSSSQPLELANVDGPASLALSNGPIAGSGASIGAAFTPAIIIGYRLHAWHDRLAIETILGLPVTVKFTATGTLADKSLAPTALGIPTGVMPLGPDLGEAKAVPPVVTAVYDLTGRGRARPYVGAGVAMLFAYDAHVTNAILTQVSQPQFDISPAPGLVVQSGLDVRIWRNIFARLDVKFIALMLAHAELHHVQVATPGLPLFGSADVGTAKMNVWVNPLIVQLGIGTDF